jgi:hypothetical protein
MQPLNILNSSPFDRRGFFKKCAACISAPVCAAMAKPAPAALPDPLKLGPAAKTKLRLVFTQAPRDVEGWPYVNFDYESKKKEFLAKVEAACPNVEFLPATSMSAAESKAILEKDAEVDGYLVYLMGIPSRGAGTTIVMSGKRVVVADHLYGGTGEFLGCAGPARRQGLPVAAVSSSRFEDVSQSVRALDAVVRMKNEAIVCVAKRDRSKIEAGIRESMGTKVVTISGTELNALYDKVSEKDGLEWAQQWIKGAARVVEPTKAEIVEGGRMYLAMVDLLKQQKSQAITVDCLDLFYAKQLRAYPCLGFFQLNNDNHVGACEADLTSTATMLLMGLVSGQPGFISDPVIDTSKNQIIYAHCVGSSRVYGPKGKANPYEIRSHSEDRKGAAVRSLMPLGVMTTTLEFLPLKKEVLLHQAKAVENIDEDKACRTKLAAEVKDAFKLIEGWRDGWHRVTYYGDLRPAVEAAASLMGFKVTVEG